MYKVLSRVKWRSLKSGEKVGVDGGQLDFHQGDRCKGP